MKLTLFANFALTAIGLNGQVILSNSSISSEKYDDSNSIVVNEAAVKTMGLKSPIGTTIYFWDSPVKIIGIMEDFVSASAYQKVAPMPFLPITEFNAQVVLVRLNETQKIGSSFSKIDEIVKGMNPEFPVPSATMNFGAVDFIIDKILGYCCRVYYICDNNIKIHHEKIRICIPSS